MVHHRIDDVNWDWCSRRGATEEDQDTGVERSVLFRIGGGSTLA